MAALKPCDYRLPHDMHSYEEQSPMPYGHRQYFMCPGEPGVIEKLSTREPVMDESAKIRAHKCNEGCRVSGLDKVHERTRMVMRGKRLAKLRCRRPMVRWMARNSENRPRIQPLYFYDGSRLI